MHVFIFGFLNNVHHRLYFSSTSLTQLDSPVRAQFSHWIPQAHSLFLLSFLVLKHVHQCSKNLMFDWATGVEDFRSLPLAYKIMSNCFQPFFQGSVHPGHDDQPSADLGQGYMYRVNAPSLCQKQKTIHTRRQFQSCCCWMKRMEEWNCPCVE